MSIQYAGGTNINTTFTGAVKADIVTNVMAQLLTAGWSTVTGITPGAVTISVASPGVITWNANGLLANDQVVFSTTGALPTGITAGTSYFVKTILTANTFTISATAGGAVINTSGTQSGTHSAVGTVRMASAATPWGVTMRVKMQDNGGACVTFSIENSTSSLVGANSTVSGGQLLPAAAKTFRIVASKFQCFVFMPITTTARGYVGFGTPYLPTFLQGVITECGWLQSNAFSDSDATLRPSFRTSIVAAGASGNQGAYQQAIVNGTIRDFAPTTATDMGAILIVQPIGPTAGYATGQTGTHWHDASAIMYEPLIAWSAGSAGEPLIRGQLWDAALICDTFAGDTTTTFDTHNWLNLVDNNTATKASLFVVVP